jgi:hypothetical protein
MKERKQPKDLSPQKIQTKDILKDVDPQKCHGIKFLNANKCPICVVYE